ncbi:MAG: hypothetical protein AB1454_10480 [Candidatus Auribacterota bacterium]
MRIFAVIAAFMLIITLAGCSNPWNPYPYINAIPTEKTGQETSATE